MTNYLTETQIVEDLLSKLVAEDIEVIKEVATAEDMSQFHHSVGMAIRNEYGLWREDNPLVSHWFAKPEDHDIRDGVDYSEDHPDSVSHRILMGVWEKVHEQT